MSRVILELKKVNCFYPMKGDLPFQAVKDVSLNVFEGEILGLMGESGSGKSTLAKAMLGTFVGCQGTIVYKDQNIYEKNWRKNKIKPIQMVMQDSKSSMNPRMTLFESMEEPLLLVGVKDPLKRQAKVKGICKLVGLDLSTASKLPGECSGGQRQRANIGRSLVLSPELLLLDEPVSSLDASIQAQIINLLRKISKETNTAMVFISHDEKLLNYLCHRILVMDQGKISNLEN
jgi:ABC-type dipeptide/oligopeptide/nickel transport system ATPase subunit